MLEKTIEARLRDGIKAAGGLCLKLVCPGMNGVPDRLILLPGGVAFFAETKRPGETERKRQKLVHRDLRRLGFTVFNTVDSYEKVDAICAYAQVLVDEDMRRRGGNDE